VPRRQRAALARLRMGSHWLGNKLGIYAAAAERQRERKIICVKCSSKISRDSNPMLLCDHCNCGWHMQCLESPHSLISIPEDSWFCPSCVVAGKTTPEALCSRDNRIKAAQSCPFCGQVETEWHALVSCGLYNSLRDEYSDLFPFHLDASLHEFFAANQKTTPKLCEFVYKCYKLRQSVCLN
jgi:predicted amidophosphoribosyltransferase